MQTKPQPLPDLFIVGTDTGVGKSVISLLLMQRLFAKGYTPFYLKPFQTGCRNAHDQDSDAGFIYRYTAALKNRDPAEAVIYCHPNPKAPYYAARNAGQSIDLQIVHKAVAQKNTDYSPLVIEAAGGLLVPITREMLLIDMVRSLGSRPLLVAGSGLGTINHTLLSIEALRRRRLEPIGVVLVDQPGQTQPADFIMENTEAIETYGQVRVGGVIAAIADFSNPPETAYQPLDVLLFEKNPIDRC